MKKSELKNCPQWLKEAVTENENVEWGNNWLGVEVVQWLGGNFLGGNFWGGNFWGGDFWGGDFLGGNFRGGDFRGGNFWGGTVNGIDGAKVILTVTRCDGYPKTLVDVKGVAWILAGCRWFTLEQAYKHWADKPDRAMTLAMLKGASELARVMELRESDKPKRAAPKRKTKSRKAAK